jgi:hypothetical protein
MMDIITFILGAGKLVRYESSGLAWSFLLHTGCSLPPLVLKPRKHRTMVGPLLGFLGLPTY